MPVSPANGGTAFPPGKARKVRPIARCEDCSVALGPGFPADVWIGVRAAHAADRTARSHVLLCWWCVEECQRAIPPVPTSWLLSPESYRRNPLLAVTLDDLRTLADATVATYPKDLAS